MLYIRPLEIIKDIELKRHIGNVESFINIPRCIDSTLQWWIENIHTCYKNISVPKPDLTIYTDASLKMYGAYDKTKKLKLKNFGCTMNSYYILTF